MLGVLQVRQYGGYECTPPHALPPLYRTHYAPLIRARFAIKHIARNALIAIAHSLYGNMPVYCAIWQSLPTSASF